MYKFGPVQKKILLALLGGVALGLSGSPRQYFRTFRKLQSEWKKIDQRSFARSFKRLSQCKLVEERKLSDGSFKLILTSEGKRQARILSLLGNSIKFKKSKNWDGKWRIVLFDIPEKDRIFRDILREHLRELKFFKLQHSVFISPEPFEKPILELISLYSAQSYIRVITAIKIDNEAYVKRHFFKKHKK
jgi:DNA-binding transcriptional regulator PaaX